MEQAIPAHLREDDFDTSQLASEDKLERARKLALEFAVLDTQIEALEKQIELKKERKNELQQKIIPQFFDENEIGGIDLPGCVSEKNPKGVKIAIAPHYHANIRSDWPEKQKQKAFEYLEKEGHGGVVRVTLSVDFAKGDLPQARKLEQVIRQWSNEYTPKLEMGVPWNTLTALVRSEIENGQSVDLDVLGAKVIRQAKVVKLEK